MDAVQQCQAEIRRLRGCVRSWTRTVEAMQKLERLLTEKAENREIDYKKAYEMLSLIIAMAQKDEAEEETLKLFEEIVREAV